MRLPQSRLLALCGFLLTALSCLAQTQPPQLIKESFNGHVDYYAYNPGFGDLTITFEFALVNAQSSLPPPYTIAVPGRKRIKAVTLRQIEDNTTWSYTMKYTWTPGNFAANPDQSVVYRLPYPSGKSYFVGQGAQGKFSHTGESAYAIDWNMPEGSPVCAARDGLVIAIRQENSGGGTNKTLFGSKANYVQVQHADGTVGEYVHLQKNGAVVKPGQAIKAGQLIGRSGNTGYSTGPHLHFMVYKPLSGNKKQSIPMRFKAVEGSLLVLEQGKSYTAP